MIYVSGDGFAAASYVCGNYSYSSQDPAFTIKGLSVHPQNLESSFAKFLSNALHQSLRLDAYEYKAHLQILIETVNFINSNTVDYIIITWPNFYRDMVEFNGQVYQFSFQKMNELKYPEDVMNQIRQTAYEFDLHIRQAEFIENLKAVCDLIESKNIKYLFMMSDTCIDIDFGNWLFNPKTQTIKAWAEDNNLLNIFGFLNQIGHKELAKLILKHLTK
jgi:hypothetical protein